MRRRAIWVSIAIVAAAAATVWAAIAGERQRLPYDGIAAARSGYWRDFGGLWSLQGNEIANRSDEPGAKLLAGSRHWRDLRFSADMRMLRRRGEVGLIVRANDMGVGINAYRGYYAGYRSMDNAMVLGFSDRDWIETQPVPLRQRPGTSEWMHLELIAVNCDVAAVLRVNSTGETVRSLMHEEGCAPKGMVGLRSVSTGATWRNIRAETAGAAAIQEVRSQVRAVGRAIYPKREDDLTRMLALETGKPDRYFSDFVLDHDDRSELNALAAAQPIASLGAMPEHGETATLHGAVTHIEPLYVQDDSGGIEVRNRSPVTLNLGDEVELTGQTAHRGGDRFFEASSLRVLWDDASTRPVAVQPDQVVSESFDGTLVELNGTLLSRTRLPDGRVRLLMRAGAEEFVVAVEPGLSQHSAADWEPGSTLRVRGVCSAEHEDLPATALFALLPRSIADVQLVSGPPWTSGWRLALVIGLSLLLLGAFGFIFLRAERWKMRTLYEERERLAADMHDTLAQGFAGIGYQLQSLRRGLRENATVPMQLMRKLDTACELATETHREASTRITALHYAADEEFDLLEVLRRMATLMLGRERSLEVHTERVGSERELSLAMRDALFRIGHEAIANVLRHSRATAMVLRLTYREADVVLEVWDNGQGFADADAHGFGIDSMRARAEECRGSLSIRSDAEAGTTLFAELPYAHRGQAWQKLRRALGRAFQRHESREIGPLS